MARQLQAAHAARTAAGVLTLLAMLLSVAAQEAAPVREPPPMPAPFSRDCHVANAEVIVESPLPNVAAALEKAKRIRILAIGAAAHAGLRGKGTYTEQIERILQNAVTGLDVVMINRGVSGELAANAAARIKVEVALNRPHLVLWQVGTNDALAYVSLDELRSTLVDTIRWLKSHKIDVVLVGLQFVRRMNQDEHYRAVRELLRAIAEQENVVIVRRSEAARLLTQAAESGGGLFPEEFARTERGYACLAEYMARAITLGVFGRGLRDQPSAAPPGQGVPMR